MKQKRTPKSIMLACNTRGLITTTQTKTRPVFSATPHLKTPVYLPGDDEADWEVLPYDEEGRGERERT